MTVSSDHAPGPGEARTRKRQRKMIAYYGVSGIVGLSLGLTLALVEQGEGNFIAGDIASLSLDPFMSIILATGFALGLFVIPLWGFPRSTNIRSKTI